MTEAAIGSAAAAGHPHQTQIIIITSSNSEAASVASNNHSFQEMAAEATVNREAPSKAKITTAIVAQRITIITNRKISMIKVRRRSHRMKSQI